MTVAERLAEAEAAYHSLMIGTSARVYVDQNGERVEYNTMNAGRLMAYIEQLRRLLNPCAPTGPMRVWM